MNTGLGHALYSFPVCGAVSLSTSPGFTCFRAGFPTKEMEVTLVLRSSKGAVRMAERKRRTICGHEH